MRWRNWFFFAFRGKVTSSNFGVPASIPTKQTREEATRSGTARSQRDFSRERGDQSHSPPLPPKQSTVDREPTFAELVDQAIPLLRVRKAEHGAASGGHARCETFCHFFTPCCRAWLGAAQPSHTHISTTCSCCVPRSWPVRSATPTRGTETVETGENTSCYVCTARRCPPTPNFPEWAKRGGGRAKSSSFAAGNNGITHARQDVSRQQQHAGGLTDSVHSLYVH